MSTQKIDLADFADKLGEFYEKSQKDVRKATLKGMLRSIPDLAAASPVDTGLYAASWDVIPSEKTAIIGNYAPYAGIIEDGARPFTPPIGPLLAWAKRVLSDPSQAPDYSSKVWALAKHTQKKISEHGMEPHHVLRDMLPKIIENIRLEMKHG